MSFAPVLQQLRGRPVFIEVGHPGRQAPQQLSGHVWGLFFSNPHPADPLQKGEPTVLLLITFNDTRENKPIGVITAEHAEHARRSKERDDAAKAATAAGQPLTNIPPPPAIPDTQYVFREWELNWVNISQIISVKSDAHARLNLSTGGFSRPKLMPLFGAPVYAPGFHLINNALSRQILVKLEEMGFTTGADHTGIFVDAAVNRVPFEKAEFPASAGAAAQLGLPAVGPNGANSVASVPPSQQVLVDSVPLQ